MNDFDRAAERVDRKIKFYRNFISYVLVNAFLALINLFYSHRNIGGFYSLYFFGESESL